MFDLFDTYPELGERIGALCRGAPWCVTGASALIHDDEAFYFELTKPKHWSRRQDGAVVVGIGGIGGSVEPGETILDCLYREVKEELGVDVRVGSADQTFLVYEDRIIDPMVLPQRDHPRPVFLTISENLFRRQIHPEFQVLAIVTFLARLEAGVAPDDLFGILAVPTKRVASVFQPEQPTIHQLSYIPGVRLLTQDHLPENAVLSPVWTARTFRKLVLAGCLSELAGPPQ